MVEKVVVGHARVALAAPEVRLDLVRRVATSAARQRVEVVAFGFGRGELRLVLAGERLAISRLVAGVKVGTGRVLASRGRDPRWEPSCRSPVPPGTVEEAVAWAHAAPLEDGAADLLDSPWSSHRDLLGMRRAPFYDPEVARRRRVSGRRVHALAGGRALSLRQLRPSRDRESLAGLLRLAGEVQGRLPTDPGCFPLFVQLARDAGWSNREIAQGLLVTRRRVRQLLGREVAHLAEARRCLGWAAATATDARAGQPHPGDPSPS